MGNFCSACSACTDNEVLNESVVSDIQVILKHGVAIDLDAIKDHKMDSDDVIEITQI